MLTIVSCAVILSAAPLDLTWGSGPQGLKKLAATPDDLLQRQVLAVLKGYGVTTVEQRGGTPSVVLSSNEASTYALTGLTKAERVALLSLIGRQARGSEFDLLIPQADGSFIPVSLWWDTPEKVAFTTGPAWKPPAAGDVSAAKLQDAFKIEIVDGDAKWDAAGLSALDQALRSLSPEELQLVTALKFRRSHVKQKHLALYQRGDDTNLIDVYDSAFSMDGEFFVGEPTAPRPYLLVPLLHELGHAIADARMRELGLANLALRKKYEASKSDDDFKAADGAVRRLLAIDAANSAGRPVEREFVTVLPQKKSPTTYGRTRPAEHFAESFTLWKNDPAALTRVSPEASAFFDGGKHVAIAGKKLE